ncbi:hypothetical protein [Methanothermobacter sp.]|nr:hypothetical protein [Methanothermobacter sp.]MDI9617743.1 hypothetical protein [Methanothermobacter sp.]
MDAWKCVRTIENLGIMKKPLAELNRRKTQLSSHVKKNKGG